MVVIAAWSARQRAGRAGGQGAEPGAPRLGFESGFGDRGVAILLDRMLRVQK
jgi:hypothetical protein